jgi:primosomal protein N' (replication factor Y)
VLQHDYQSMYRMQIDERKAFNYPPFSRLVRISLKHKEQASLNVFADRLGIDLRKYFGNRVLGPEFPVISQIQTWYIKTILIKIEKEKPLGRSRLIIKEAIERLEKEKGAGALKIAVDMDPY